MTLAYGYYLNNQVYTFYFLVLLNKELLYFLYLKYEINPQHTIL